MGKPMATTAPYTPEPIPVPGFALFSLGMDVLKRSVMDFFTARAARKPFRVPSDEEMGVAVKAFQDAAREQRESARKPKKNRR